MNSFLYIARLTTLSLILAVSLVLAPARAQNVVYQGETSTLSVDQKPGDTYEWELYDTAPIDFVKTPGMKTSAGYATFVGGNTGANVQVKWLLPGTYFFKVTAWNVSGCTNNIAIGIMEVKPSLPTAVFAQPNPDWICIGESAELEVTLTGVAPWEITYTDGTSFWTVNNITTDKYLIKVTPSGTAQYWITEVKNVFGTNSTPSAKVTIVVNPRPTSSPIYQHDP